MEQNAFDITTPKVNNASGTIKIEGGKNNVGKGDSITITVTGKDPDGIKRIGILEDNNKKYWSSPGTTSFSHSFTYTASGNHNFKGMIEGFYAGGWAEVEEKYADPAKGVTVHVGTANSDHLPSGTMSSPSSVVKVKQEFTITVQGNDIDGGVDVGIKDGDNGGNGEKGGIQWFQGKQHTWRITKKNPGNYNFYGYVRGKNPTIPWWWFFASKKVRVATSPAKITIHVLSSSTDIPTTGSMTVSDKKVKPGQTFTITIVGSDPDGVKAVELFRNQGRHLGRYGELGKSHTWLISEDNPGTYRYNGFVIGLDAQGKETQAVLTTPQEVTVEVTYF